MRYVFLILILLLSFTSLFTQTTYHFNTPPQVKWAANTEFDLAGYEVHMARWGYNSGIRDTITISVTEEFYSVTDEYLIEADYFFGVSAIDSSGNKSSITWSHVQCYLNPNHSCWFARYDITPPASVGVIQPGL